MSRAREDEATGRKRTAQELEQEAQRVKRIKIDEEERITGLLAKIGDNEELVVRHLTALTDVLVRDIPQHYAHIINELMKCILVMPQKLGVYATLIGTLARKCTEQFSLGEGAATFPKGATVAPRILCITLEMLDRDLVAGTWWKTMALVKLAGYLIFVNVLHAQNLWNILREIVDEVMNANNSANRRDAYCFMVLSALEVAGLQLHRFQLELKNANASIARSEDDEFYEICSEQQHKPVDFVQLYEDIAAYMGSRTNKSQDQDSRLVQTWRAIQEFHAKDWKGCDYPLAEHPFLSPMLKDWLPLQAPLYPVATLRKTLLRGGRAVAPIGDVSKSTSQDPMGGYLRRILECKKRNHAEEALKLWDEARAKKFKPTLPAFMAMVSICSSMAAKDSCGRVRQLWNELLANGLVPTTKMLNTILTILMKGGDEKLFEFYEQACGSLSPDLTTFSILLSVCEALRRSDLAMDFYHDMKRRGLQPDLLAFTALIRLCRAHGDVVSCASLWVDCTREYGLQPDKNMYQIVESVFQSAAQLNNESFHKMKNCVPTGTASDPELSRSTSTLGISDDSLVGQNLTPNTFPP